jgi:hypothetical protein
MSDKLVLHMGFVNTPYNAASKARPATAAKAEEKRARKRSFRTTMTAEKVSGILEGKYGIVETFQAIHEEEIHNLMMEGFADAATSFLAKNKPFTTASLKNLMKPNTQQIVKMFRQFLDMEEMNGVVPGVPTKISGGRKRKRGISTPPRPSFERTGIYRASFRCWADTK